MSSSTSREDMRQRVMAIYAAADAAVAAAGPRCDASGRCCRFTEYGHTLFISQLEAEVLLAAAPPFGGHQSHGIFAVPGEQSLHGPRAATARLPSLFLRPGIPGNRRTDQRDVPATIEGFGR